jgi:D-3-phosphoglycerate dehydrogenase
MPGRDGLFSGCDVLTLHVPLTPETRHSIGAREFALMRPGSILINASRGGVVDESALHAALTGGPLRAAAVDVFESEPAPADHPNVLALPHLGASTAEAQRRAGNDAVDTLLEVLAGA